MGFDGAATRGAADHLAHRIDHLAAKQEQRRLAIDFRIVERIGDDFRQPHHAGLHIPQVEQLQRTEQQRTDADEIMISTRAHSLEARARSLTLVAKHWPMGQMPSASSSAA